MCRVKLYKLFDLPNADYPNSIIDGFVAEDELIRSPQIGSQFIFGTLLTSVVTEIIDEHTFKTMNSIYRIVPDTEKLLKPKPFLAWQYHKYENNR